MQRILRLILFFTFLISKIKALVNVKDSWINGTVMKYPYDDSYNEKVHEKHGGEFRAVADPKRKIIGCWIAKVGSRELDKTFFQLTEKYRHDFKITPHEMMQDPEYKRFVVIRDPLTRLVSAYMDKYSWLTPQWANSIPMWKLKARYNGTVTRWEDYLKDSNQSTTLKLLLKTLHLNKYGELDTSDIHLKPQYRLCHLKEIRYDYVMDLNHISYGFKSLKERENIDIPLLGFNHGGLKPHVHNANQRICDHVDEWVEQKARDIYKHDYEVFEAFGMTNLLFNVTELCKDHVGELLVG